MLFRTCVVVVLIHLVAGLRRPCVVSGDGPNCDDLRSSSLPSGSVLETKVSEVSGLPSFSAGKELLESVTGVASQFFPANTTALLIEVVDTLPAQVEEWYRAYDTKCRSSERQCVSNILVQQHESWERVMKEPFQAQALLSNKENARYSGWEYKFFDGEARNKYVRSGFWKQVGLVVEKTDATQSGKRFQLVVNIESDDLVANEQVLSRLPLWELFDLLEDGVTRADLFRYMIIYELGGVYFDSKSGVEYSQETRYSLNRVFHELGEAPFWLADWGVGQSGMYVECDRKVEFLQWMLAAHPRHRYLWRAIELVAAQVFMLATQGDYATQTVLAKCSDWHKTFGSMWDRGMKVLLTTGPIAFSNAILWEQRRMQTMNMPESGVVVKDLEQERHIRYIDARWPTHGDLSEVEARTGRHAVPGYWLPGDVWQKLKFWNYGQGGPLVKQLASGADGARHWCESGGDALGGAGKLSNMKASWMCWRYHYAAVAACFACIAFCALASWHAFRDRSSSRSRKADEVPEPA
eukprot:TRINITY_DN104071_c0_g1_i1.p1 TRINITY_DN104071_c0_g1~~TRINITY_DN104071_c0_g1_i1.p1  ORF type:complete len:523 (-),score=59.74 TRINITY_DN104071_c0_g1_i1:129-1697(-)